MYPLKVLFWVGLFFLVQALPGMYPLKVVSVWVGLFFLVKYTGKAIIAPIRYSTGGWQDDRRAD